jgi:tetratricopeptide (TPR) repeat protein
MHTVHGRKVHSVDVSKFLEEVKFLHNEYDINVIAIEDDTFNFNKKRAIEILEGINKISNKIEVEIPSGFALQLMDEELIATLRDCGVKWQQIAIESASKEILNNVIHKPLKIEKATEIIDLLQKYDIYVRAFFMLGFPTETKEQMEETIQFMLDNKINWNGIGMLKPISGSKIREICEDGGCLSTSDIEMVTERIASIRTEHFTPEEIDKIVYIANIETNFVNNYDLFRGGKPEKAIIGFDFVLSRAPEHLFALYYKAVAYEQMGDSENAKEYFQKANSVMRATKKWDNLIEKYGLKGLIVKGAGRHH